MDVSCAGIGASYDDSCFRSMAVLISMRLLDRPMKWHRCASTLRLLKPSNKPSWSSWSSSFIESAISGVSMIEAGRPGVECRAEQASGGLSRLLAAAIRVLSSNCNFALISESSQW